jgi:hypothetical protein
LRQLARVSAINYHETLWSELFAGNQLTLHCLRPAVLGVERSFELTAQARQRTLYRLDGGAGTDDNLRWLLGRGYQVIAKGYSGKRADALARRVSRWDQADAHSWLGWVRPTFDLARPIRVMVKRRLHNGCRRHSYYVTTLSFASKQAFMQRYNQRGGAEIEQFRADKQALHLSTRRKRRFEAQKGLILPVSYTHLTLPTKA